MTPLRQRLLADLPLRGLPERTQAMDVRAVRQLADPYHTSPAPITEEALRDDVLSLTHVQPSSRRASTMALCGMQVFYEPPLTRDWPTLTFMRPPQEPTHCRSSLAWRQSTRSSTGCACLGLGPA
jgi:hypothetical protein